jgi:hypothetical protein
MNHYHQYIMPKVSYDEFQRISLSTQKGYCQLCRKQ